SSAAPARRAAAGALRHGARAARRRLRRTPPARGPAAPAASPRRDRTRSSEPFHRPSIDARATARRRGLRPPSSANFSARPPGAPWHRPYRRAVHRPSLAFIPSPCGFVETRWWRGRPLPRVQPSHTATQQEAAMHTSSNKHQAVAFALSLITTLGVLGSL